LNFCFQTTYNESFFFINATTGKKEENSPRPFFLFGQNKTMTLFCVAVIANDDQKPTFSGDSRFSVFFPLLDSNKTTRFFYSKIG